MYKINGECVFGNGVMDENGMMDDTQFVENSNIEQYYADIDAATLLNVAKQYGAKPVTKIECNVGVINIYRADVYFVAQIEYKDSFFVTVPYALRNTVSPRSIVEYAIKNAYIKDVDFDKVLFEKTGLKFCAESDDSEI